MLKKLRLLTLILAVCLLSAQLTFADAMVFYNNDHRVCYWVTVSASDGGCNFRYGPGVEYDKIFSRMIPNGTLLSVDRQADAANGKPWGYVQYNGRYGWIALSQVSLAYIPAGESAPSFFFRSMPSGSFDSGASSGSLKRASYDVTVSASDGGCNLRYGAGVEHEKLMDNMIPNGTGLHIYWEQQASNGNTWGFTSYNNMNGWIALSEVSVTNPNSSVSAVNYHVQPAAPEGGINLRSGAGVDYEILLSGLIPNGTTLAITEETTAASNGRFWGYTTYNGTSGWVTLEQVVPVAEVLTGSANTTSSEGAVGKAYKADEPGTLIAAAEPGFLRPDFVLQLIVTVLVVAAGVAAAARVLQKK